MTKLPLLKGTVRNERVEKEMEGVMGIEMERVG